MKVRELPMYAVVKNGGKQYKVSEGDILCLDKMSKESKTAITLDKVLMIDNNGDIKVGAPFLEGAKVEAEVINEGKDKKVIIFKKRRRKDSKVKRGFRRQFTRVRITKISA
jgi:large subunit ribosomal protein L21